MIVQDVHVRADFATGRRLETYRELEATLVTEADLIRHGDWLKPHRLSLVLRDLIEDAGIHRVEVFPVDLSRPYQAQVFQRVGREWLV